MEYEWDNFRSIYTDDTHFREYQEMQCDKLSDHDIIAGMIVAYQEPACTNSHGHNTTCSDHFATDECRFFRYPQGTIDHYNIRWFQAWCLKRGKEYLWKRIMELKLFW